MRNFLKNYILLFLGFFLLLYFLLANTNVYLRSLSNSEQKVLEMAIKCLEDREYRSELGEICEDAIAAKDKNPEFYSVFTNTAIFGLQNKTLLIILVTIIPSIWIMTRYLKNNVICNEVTRANFKKIKKRLFTKAYLSTLILPLIMGISFVICYLYTGNFAYERSLGNSVIWQESTMANGYLFIFLYLLNILIHTTLYVNIGMSTVRKYYNFFVALIVTFLKIVAIEVFLEICLGGILFKSLLKSDMGIIFNIVNTLAFEDAYGILPMMSVPLAIMLITSFIVYQKYKAKEQLIIDCNNN